MPSFQRKFTQSDFSWFVLLMLLCFFILPSYAADTVPPPTVSTVTAQTMLENIAKQMPNLMRMVTAIAYVIGMYFIYIGVNKLKQLGEARTMMSQEHSFAGPAAYFAAGAMLLYLPSSVQMGMSTFWTNPNPYGYIKNQDQWAEFLKTVFLVVQFIGTIAFIRGLIMLAKLGGHGSQQEGLGKALAHIIGGIFAINIYQFTQMVLSTLGISISGS